MSSIPRRLLNGVSCAVMAYGQTGSGKVSVSAINPGIVVDNL